MVEEVLEIDGKNKCEAQALQVLLEGIQQLQMQIQGTSSISTERPLGYVEQAGTAAAASSLSSLCKMVGIECKECSSMEAMMAKVKSLKKLLGIS